MSSAIYGVFFFTVALLFITGYFILGGLPLLVLEHDVPLDARFIRRFFEVYYRAAFWAAMGATVSCALWGRVALALGAGGIAVVAVLLRTRFLPVMQELGLRIEAQDPGAIQRFRRLHATALLINLALLAVLVWGTIEVSRSM